MSAQSHLAVAISLVDRRLQERRDKAARSKNEYERGYNSGYRDAMKFARSELDRIARNL